MAIKYLPRALLASFFAFTTTAAVSDSKAPGAPAGSEPAIGVAPVLDDRYPERRIAFPGGVVGFPDLTYESLKGYRPLTLDLYRPRTTTPAHALVLYVHGGGWQSGHTRHSGAFENWPAVLASIAARGYVVASVEYRLSGEAQFPAAIQDVKAAIRWLRRHSSQYGIDPRRAVIWGGSAGGQLAALAGTTCGIAALEPPDSSELQRPEPGAARGSASMPAQTTSAKDEVSDCVQGVIAWYGIFDFSLLVAQSSKGPQADDPAASPARYLGCALSKCSSNAIAAASAIHYVDARDAPVLMIHGVDDHTVPIQQSRTYLAALKAKGVGAELLELPGVDHSFIGATPTATRTASLQALQKSLDFIDRTMGLAHD
jgi:acetyl esterase/lipase